MGTEKASEIWGVPQNVIQKWCRDGKIKGAMQDKKGSPWFIPDDIKQSPIKYIKRSTKR
ncbi:MAG: helix-turn-helix domain-containing protein [Clostridia bacterium]|nr:helix-turn-helix domain-containing protein [Clostridia bacterium]